MANMTLTKTPMPEQDPKVRARNFEEVALGYTAQVRGGLPRQRAHSRIHRQGR